MGLADLIQLGSAAVAPGDIVGAVRDIYRRAQFAMCVEEQTNYILERRERINQYIKMSTTPDDPIEERKIISTSVEEVLVDANRYFISPDSIQWASTKRGKFEKILNRIRIAVKKELAQRLHEDMKQKQNDSLLEEILKQVCITNKSLEDIIINQKIFQIVGRCDKSEQAKVLLNSQYAVLEIESLMVESNDFECIADENLECKIRHKGNEIQRNDDSFKVLLSVITALFVAEREEWYHRRLSTKYISIRKKESLNTLPYAKVHSFRCPISRGCPDVRKCLNCRSEYETQNSSKKKEKLDRVNQEEDNSVRFWYSVDSTAQFDPITDAAKIDPFSFASFTLWLFSGQTIQENHITRKVLESVPWPLRWIVLEKEKLSLHEVFSYLHSIDKGVLDPYLYSSDSPFPMVTGKKQELSEADVESMREAIVKSINHGVDTEDPEAMVQMGLLIEHVNKRNSEAADSGRPPLTLAKKYFILAGVCGEVEGYFRYAFLASRSLERNIKNHSQLEEHIRKLCDYLLYAAKGGCWKSMYVMKTMTLPNQSGGFRKIFSEAERSVEERIHYNEEHTLDAIYRMGHCLRRGMHGLPQLLDLAEKFLEYAASRELLDAKLELALLKRQRADENSEEMNHAVEIVKKLCNTRPHPTGYSACYWYGFWNWQFSNLSGGDRKQKALASEIAKKYLSAATFRTDVKTKKTECTEELNAMALYSRIVEREKNGGDNRLRHVWNSKWNDENSLKFPFMRLIKGQNNLDRLKKEFEGKDSSNRRLQIAVKEYEQTIVMMTFPFDRLQEEHPKIAFDPRLLFIAAINLLEFGELLCKRQIRKDEYLRKAIKKAKTRFTQILNLRERKRYRQYRVDYIHEDRRFFQLAASRLRSIS